MNEISLIPRIITIKNIGKQERTVNVSGSSQFFILYPGHSVVLKVQNSSEMIGYISQADETLLIDCVEEVVSIPEPDEKVFFDASSVLGTAGMFERGSTGIDHGHLYVPQAGAAPGNLETLDNWNWSKNGVLKSSPQQMTWDDKNGAWNYKWTFQTNTPTAKYYLLNIFELNGVRVSLPTKPSIKVSRSGVITEVPDADYIRTSFLPDGTAVTVEILRCFADQSQIAYSVQITGAKKDIVVTDANLDFRYDTLEMREKFRVS